MKKITIVTDANDIVEAYINGTEIIIAEEQRAEIGGYDIDTRFEARGNDVVIPCDYCGDLKIGYWIC